MGNLNVEAAFDSKKSRYFLQDVLNDLEALNILISEGYLETGIQRIGAEQELCLIDKHLRPAPILTSLLDKIEDEHFTTELARFNIEMNLDPLEFKGDCFRRLKNQLEEMLARLSSACRDHEADFCMTGILPTIRNHDLSLSNLTPLQRYQGLFKKLRDMRGGGFDYHIRGADLLRISHTYPTFEFCNTSFQVHFQPYPERFVESYNVARLISAPVLAAAVNSPLLLGKRLWAETRIALFQQSIDSRRRLEQLKEISGRVSFSRHWTHNILEDFKDDISRFRPLLYAEHTENSLDMLSRGKMPKLAALQIFNGTIYRWNRACYGVGNGKPHLRIENRYLPSGPTVDDEIANTAFWIGIMNGFDERYENLHDKIIFDNVMDNFTRAARSGLDSSFHWLNKRSITARDLILDELLPVAHAGLNKAGVNKEDSDFFLSIIRERVSSGKTGAYWQSANFTKLKETISAEDALLCVTRSMVEHQKEGKPVHEWPDISETPAVKKDIELLHVGQIMTTDLFTLDEEASISLAVHIMKWKGIHHIPIEDKNGYLCGMLVADELMSMMNMTPTRPVREVMQIAPITVMPETEINVAKTLLNNSHQNYLPVVKNGTLVGIITEDDLKTS
ncbi:MAG: CBS domain-containing protein [Calditrichia bacterium]